MDLIASQKCSRVRNLGMAAWFLDDELVCRAGSRCSYFYFHAVRPVCSISRTASEIHDCINYHTVDGDLKPNIFTKTTRKSKKVTLCGLAYI